MVGLLALGPLAGATRSWWIPQTGGSWGHALLGMGVMLLSAGVACNLLWAARRRGPPSPDAGEVHPGNGFHRPVPAPPDSNA